MRVGKTVQKTVKLSICHTHHQLHSYRRWKDGARTQTFATCAPRPRPSAPSSSSSTAGRGARTWLQRPSSLGNLSLSAWRVHHAGGPVPPRVQSLSSLRPRTHCGSAKTTHKHFLLMEHVVKECPNRGAHVPAENNLANFDASRKRRTFFESAMCKSTNQGGTSQNASLSGWSFFLTVTVCLGSLSRPGELRRSPEK